MVLTSVLEMGVTGKLLAFIRDYLRNRQASICFHLPSRQLGQQSSTGCGSQPVLVQYRVATLVGRLKANLNASQRHRTSILCYADDITIICSSQDKVQQLRAEVLRVLSDTCLNLGLKISVAKTKAMLMFGDQPIVPLRAADLDVDWVDTFDYLRVRLDHELTMKPLI